MEWSRELATQMDYTFRVSTEDYVATAFMYIREKMVKRVKPFPLFMVKRPVGRSRKHPMELIEACAGRKKFRPT